MNHAADNFFTSDLTPPPTGTTSSLTDTGSSPQANLTPQQLQNNIAHFIGQNGLIPGENSTGNIQHGGSTNTMNTSRPRNLPDPTAYESFFSP